MASHFTLEDTRFVATCATARSTVASRTTTTLAAYKRKAPLLLRTEPPRSIASIQSPRLMFWKSLR